MRALLAYECRGTGGEDLLRITFIDGDQNHDRLRTSREQATSRRQPAHAGHLHVHHDQPRSYISDRCAHG
jgi:hypothetical protein